jgi:hypothetical protein
MMDAGDVIVYREWPEQVIADAITEFNTVMHDGAGVEELEAGLHGLDFLTRRSEITETLRWRLEGVEVEARMRMQLLGEQEAAQRTRDENLKMLATSVGNLKKFADHLLPRMAGIGARHLLKRYPQLALEPEYEFDEECD